MTDDAMGCRNCGDLLKDEVGDLCWWCMKHPNMVSPPEDDAWLSEIVTMLERVRRFLPLEDWRQLSEAVNQYGVGLATQVRADLPKLVEGKPCPTCGCEAPHKVLADLNRMVAELREPAEELEFAQTKAEVREHIAKFWKDGGTHQKIRLSLPRWLWDLLLT